MILYSRSSIERVIPRAVVASDLANIFDGCALINAYDAANYRFGVKRSGGAATDHFAGIARSPRKHFNSNVKVEKLTVANTTAVVLQRTAVAISAIRADTGAQVAISAGAVSTTNIQSGTDASTGNTTLAFDVSFVGVSFFVTYSYAITNDQAAVLFGESYSPRYPNDTTGDVGVIQRGLVFTNAIDPTANWAASPKVKIIASGLFTDGANAAVGVVPTNLEVMTLPTADVPYVGLVIK